MPCADRSIDRSIVSQRRAVVPLFCIFYTREDSACPCVRRCFWDKPLRGGGIVYVRAVIEDIIGTRVRTRGSTRYWRAPVSHGWSGIKIRKCALYTRASWISNRGERGNLLAVCIGRKSTGQRGFHMIGNEIIVQWICQFAYTGIWIKSINPISASLGEEEITATKSMQSLCIYARIDRPLLACLRYARTANPRNCTTSRRDARSKARMQRRTFFTINRALMPSYGRYWRPSN